MELITEHSPWWAIGCCLLGLLFAVILYRREKRLLDMPKWLKSLLAALRWAAVTALALLLLGPLLSFLENKEEKPVVILAHDNSSSLIMNKDSSFYKEEYRQNIQQLRNSIGDKYEVESYLFDKDLEVGEQIDFQGKQTDLSSMIRSLYDRNSNRNIGAVILASDGLYNLGSNPSYSAGLLEAPLHTIALGDTTVKKDLILDNITHNRLAYLGNDFPLEALIKADRVSGGRTQLKVSSKGQVLFSRSIDIDKDGFIRSLPIQLSAKEVGRQRFDISLTPIQGEFSTENNYRSIYIDVIDSRQKVLILAKAPHPDVGAIRQAVESNENYEAQVAMAGKFSGSIKDYDLLILHQLPAAGVSATSIISEAKSLKRPILYIVGLQTDQQAFNELDAGVRLSVRAGTNTTDASASMEQSFSLFKLDDELNALLAMLPPLTMPFGEFNASNSADILFNQRIGTVETGQPLIAFSDVSGQKSGVICGEGIWRWKLIDHVENGNNEQFNALIGKTVQYMATKEDRRLFRVYCKSRFNEDQNIRMEAELYNASFESITEPDVSVLIKNEEGAEFPFTFSKGASGYTLDAGKLPVGEYAYTARTIINGEQYTVSGEFIVMAIQLEAIRTTADHQLLFNLAKDNGGEMFYPNQLQQLADRIINEEEIVTVMYSSQRLTEIINLKWIFFLILLLLSIEWFIRKYNGAY